MASGLIKVGRGRLASCKCAVAGFLSGNELKAGTDFSRRAEELPAIAAGSADTRGPGFAKLGAGKPFTVPLASGAARFTPDWGTVSLALARARRCGVASVAYIGSEVKTSAQIRTRLIAWEARPLKLNTP
jgi:hypothetical protein